MAQDPGEQNPLRSALAACRAHLVNGAVFSGFINILLLAPSIYMLQVYDRAVPTRGVLTLVMLTLMFLGAIMVMAALDLVRARLLIRASARLDRLLAPRIIADLLRVSVTAAPARGALRDFDTLRQTITGAGVLALFDAPWAPVYVLVCFLLHPVIGCVALFAMALLVAVSLLNERATRTPLHQANVASNIAYASIDGSLAAAGVIKALGMRDAMVARHSGERALSLDRQIHASSTNALFVSTTKGLRIALQSLALGIGAYLAMEQQISAGAIFAASLLISRALAPIEQITAASKSLMQATASYRSLRTLFSAAARHGDDQIVLPDPRGAIDVENLTVELPRRDAPALRNVSFAVPAGHVLGIVGPSGAGKSTLARALVGTVDPTHGVVRLDGAKLDDWNAAQLGASIGYVPQEPSLFRGTVRDNISRFQVQVQGDRAAIDAEVVRAAIECGAHEMILQLPDAYDTELGWNGAGLSSGQAQRIALARALYGSPALLVLDEPNANLDSDGDERLYALLARLRARGTTICLIVHRTAILRGVDMLLVLREGQMAYFGQRDAVLEQLAGAATGGATRSPPEAAVTPLTHAHAA